MLVALKMALRRFGNELEARPRVAAEEAVEAWLAGPVSTLIKTAGRLISHEAAIATESVQSSQAPPPDLRLVVGGVFGGYVTFGVPGQEADASRHQHRDKRRWDRLRLQPNILYTNGYEWSLFQNGVLVERLPCSSRGITRNGGGGIRDADVERFSSIMSRWFTWQPVVGRKPKEQAELLAPLYRLLREEVADALCDPVSPLADRINGWRSLLSPGASDEGLADAYAQMVAFALLLARWEGADVCDIAGAVTALEANHTLLSHALQILADARNRVEIESSLAPLQRVINAFPGRTTRHDQHDAEDDWLRFYEHFLAIYDPKLRAEMGAYYTPAQVVECQVALVDDLLRTRLKKAGGFAHKDVVVIDPAVGTGTYLLGVVRHTLDTVRRVEKPKAVVAQASSLATRLHGFELMAGPYAVAELRLTRAFGELGAAIPAGGVGILLADTLESPFAKRSESVLVGRSATKSRTRVFESRGKKTVLVCLGNPPYDRHEAVGALSRESRARTGGWVRWGDEGLAEQAILNDFTEPAKLAGHGGHLKNLYNLYVYFWRWAMWQVFEASPSGVRPDPGVIAFVTASSYLRGDAFVGMREMLRRLCHEVWVIDLGGEGRGTRPDGNVFNIQTPVAICIALRLGPKDTGTPAAVRYVSIHGTREDKYAQLATIRSVKDLKWKTCPTAWPAPLRPATAGTYSKWPMLTDLMPWQQSGVMIGRLWPIAPDRDTLARRWRRLRLAEPAARAGLLKNSPTGRKATDTPLALHGQAKRLPSIERMPRTATPEAISRFAYRPFDRHDLIADARVIDRPGPSLWRSWSDRQIAFGTLVTQPLGRGPAVLAMEAIPDKHHFRGSFGGKDVLPLYRDAAGTEPNILPNLLPRWGQRLKRSITPEAFAAYMYALLGHSAFVERFWDELEDRQLRVPLTLDSGLFDRAVALGSRLISLHTYGERFNDRNRKSKSIPRGRARCTEPISDKPVDYPTSFAYIESSRVLRIGTGAVAPIAPGVWGYEVSGLKVIASWLGYRMRRRKGRESSPLDAIHPKRWPRAFTDELLQLLWVIEHTLAMQPELTELLDAVCAGQVLPASAVPAVPVGLRKPPRR